MKHWMEGGEGGSGDDD